MLWINTFLTDSVPDLTQAPLAAHSLGACILDRIQKAELLEWEQRGKLALKK
jgi:hypothetical protein